MQTADVKHAAVWITPAESDEMRRKTVQNRRSSCSAASVYNIVAQDTNFFAAAADPIACCCKLLADQWPCLAVAQLR